MSWAVYLNPMERDAILRAKKRAWLDGKSITTDVPEHIQEDGMLIDTGWNGWVFSGGITTNLPERFQEAMQDS